MQKLVNADPIIARESDSQKYEAVLRIGEAISACCDPEKLARILADEIAKFLHFDHLYLVVLKEDTKEVEYFVWGKGPIHQPDLPIEELSMWDAMGSPDPQHTAYWDTEERYPRFKEWAKEMGLGSGVHVPLMTTPHRGLGVFGISRDTVNPFSEEEISFLRLIGRVVAFALDDGLNLRRAQRQSDRLRLLLNLTNRINSNLELRELLRTIAVSIREVMNCDLVAFSLLSRASGQARLYALDFPNGKGFIKEDDIVSTGGPGMRVLDTLKPEIVPRFDLADVPPEIYEKIVAEGLKSSCVIPLVNRGRGLGSLSISRTSEISFTPDDVEFLTQASGQIAIAIENALAYREISELKDKLAQEKLYLEEEIRSEMNFENIVGNSPALKHVLELVETVAPSDSTVMLLGETGTGKELIARAIHERSRRRDRTFVKLNCAAIPTGLLESELFGHEKGAFTGAIPQRIGRLELADQGTLFLDEVGDIPLEVQPKLLRALQEREFERLGSTHTRKVNVRLIAATNRDLEKMIVDREFRSDLYYRLNVFPIRLPPLRDRRDDIPLLVSYFVQKFSKQMQKKIETVPTSVMKGLKEWDWPGNIRELENFIERAVIVTRGKSLEAPLAELRKPTPKAVVSVSYEPPSTESRDDIARIVKETITTLEEKRAVADEHSRKQHDQIVNALIQTKGRVGGPEGAAARLGLNRTTFITRMKKFGIDPRRYV